MRIKLISLILVTLSTMPFASGAAEYRDAANGFSLHAPEFGPVDHVSAQVLTIAGPPAKGFSPNCNVQIQVIDLTLDEFVDLSQKQFDGSGFEVLESSRIDVSGRPAQRWHYRGSLRGMEFEWLAEVIQKADKFFLLTCTALKDKYPESVSIFENTVQSFQLD